MWIHLRPVLPHLQEVSRGFKQVHRAYRSIIAAGVVGGLRRTFRVRLQLGLLAFAFDLMHGYPAHGIVGSYTGPPFSTSRPPPGPAVLRVHKQASPHQRMGKQTACGAVQKKRPAANRRKGQKPPAPPFSARLSPVPRRSARRRGRPADAEKRKRAREEAKATAGTIDHGAVSPTGSPYTAAANRPKRASNTA